MKKSKSNAVVIPEPKATEITSLDQINSLCDEPFFLDLDVSGKPVRFKLRRLWPQEKMMIERILAEPIPPMRPKVDAQGRAIPGQAEPDTRDKAYMEAVDRAEIEAQAVTIYWGWPALRESKPELRVKSDIAAAVYGKPGDPASRGAASPLILKAIYLAISGEGVEALERANFTTGPA